MSVNYVLASAHAILSDDIPLGDARLRVPGSLPIRLSTVLGNRRIHRLMDRCLHPGGVVVDVGANIGCNAVYAAQKVGPAGRVVAIEPAGDNLAVLRENITRNALGNVTIAPVAAGRASGTCSFYLRGDVSAVNSFYPDSVYASVTDVVTVPVEPVDALVTGNADLVKIDVEGAELDVLAGMTRVLASPSIRMIVEWHPLLQQKAGHAPDALPVALLDLGFSLVGASHTRTWPVHHTDLSSLVVSLSRSGRPIDLLAQRPI